MYILSYNRLWEAQQRDFEFPDVTSLDQLIAGLTKPFTYPHAAAFYPPHARFEAYDLIVVVYQTVDVRIVYGYQLKEGRMIQASDFCKHSYVIRGFASQTETILRGRHVASNDEIDNFLGVTGSCLAPKQWRALAELFKKPVYC
jgi:hypothetical protein